MRKCQPVEIHPRDANLQYPVQMHINTVLYAYAQNKGVGKMMNSSVLFIIGLANATRIYAPGDGCCVTHRVACARVLEALRNATGCT